jgi:hypothetical protein
MKKISAYFLIAAALTNLSPITATEGPLDTTREEQLELITAELSKKRGLLILLDEKEKNTIMAIGAALVTALYQEAGPIIVSTALFCTMLEQTAKEQRPIEAILDEANKLGHTSIALHEKNGIYISKISFQPKQWIIKKINPSLTLLIPQRYLESFNFGKDIIEEYHGNLAPISDIELKLGLKVNHMETIEAEKIIRPITATNSDYFSDSLDTIFCTKLDYLNKNINIPEWSIFIAGHGRIVDNKTDAYTYKIVGLSLNGFQKLLHFLENKINTQLQTMQSCYAAGIHSKKIYGEMELGTQKQYSFPIIIQGLNDVVASIRTASVDWQAWRNNRTIKLITHKNFFDFLKKATGLEEGDYKEIIKPISDDFISNTPQIKLPGMEWFSVMEIDKKVVSIGSILAETRNPKKALDIVAYFKKDPEVILLYTDNISFELKINSHNVKAIVSMLSSGPIKNQPEFVIHHIKKISSSQTFEKILQWFRLVASSHESKWFLIDEINDWRNIIIFRSGPHTFNVYGEQSDKDTFNVSWMPYILELKRGQQIGLVTWKAIEPNSEYAMDYKTKYKFATIDYEMARIKAKEEKNVTPVKMKQIEDALQKRDEIKKREDQKRLGRN